MCTHAYANSAVYTIVHSVQIQNTRSEVGDDTAYTDPRILLCWWCWCCLRVFLSNSSLYVGYANSSRILADRKQPYRWSLWCRFRSKATSGPCFRNEEGNGGEAMAVCRSFLPGGSPNGVACPPADAEETPRDSRLRGLARHHGAREREKMRKTASLV